MNFRPMHRRPALLVALCLPLIGCDIIDKLRHSKQDLPPPPSFTATAPSRTATPSPSAAPGPAATESASSEVRFERAVPRVGTIVSKTYAMELSMSVTAKANDKVIAESNLRQTGSERSRATVLSSDEYSVSRLKVEYLEKQETEAEDGKEESKRVSVVAGKTYNVSVKDGEIDVTDGDGDPVTTKERDEVKEDHDDLGKRNPIANLLPDRALKIGEQLKPPPTIAKELMGGKGDLEIKSVTLTFKGLEGSGGAKVGVFDMVMEFAGTGKDAPPVEAQMKGTLHLDAATSLPTSLTMSGPVTMDTKQNGTHVRAKGQTKIKLTADYQAP